MPYHVYNKLSLMATDIQAGAETGTESSQNHKIQASADISKLSLFRPHVSARKRQAHQVPAACLNPAQGTAFREVCLLFSQETFLGKSPSRKQHF